MISHIGDCEVIFIDELSGLIEAIEVAEFFVGVLVIDATPAEAVLVLIDIDFFRFTHFVLLIKALSRASASCAPKLLATILRAIK